MLNLGHVVLFKNLDTSDLQASLAAVFQFFSETYDTISSRKTAGAYRLRAHQAVNGRSASEGCWEGIPTALYGARGGRRAEAGQLAEEAVAEAPPRVEPFLLLTPP